MRPRVLNGIRLGSISQFEGTSLNRFARLIEQWDSVEPTRLLRWNAVIAALVLIAHGGFLLTRGSSGANPDESAAIAYVSLPLCSAALAGALLAWVRPDTRISVLRFHCTILLIGALYSLWSAMSWTIGGIPRGSFSWNPVFFAFVIAYPVYLARRVLIPETMRGIPIVRYSHVLVAGLSVVISAGIFWRVWDWKPSPSNFNEEKASSGASLVVPRFQSAPAVPEIVASGTGDAMGSDVTLLSTSFEAVTGLDPSGSSPFVQIGTLPWARDSRARSGDTAMNVIPHGNPGDFRYSDKSISPVLLSAQLVGPYQPFDVSRLTRVELEFWRLSTSNPSTTHNCLGSLAVDYRFDGGPWVSKMVFCGRNASKPPEWSKSTLEFSVAGHKALEFRFDYEYPPDTHRDANAVYLIDDLVVRGYR